MTIFYKSIESTKKGLKPGFQESWAKYTEKNVNVQNTHDYSDGILAHKSYTCYSRCIVYRFVLIHLREIEKFWKGDKKFASKMVSHMEMHGNPREKYRTNEWKLPIFFLVCLLNVWLRYNV